MPVATPYQYRQMLDTARRENFAFPAINVSTVTAVNGALKGLAEAGSDGILQILPCAAEFACGDTDTPAVGAIVLAEAAHRLARQYDIVVGLHTDHCLPEQMDSFLIPLIEETEKRRSLGLGNLFNSHMFDGSRLPLEENIALSKQLLKRCVQSDIILEIEAGVVGGNEIEGDPETADGVTTPEEMLEVYKALQGEGQYLFAAAFGNLHGSYKSGTLNIQPEVLRRGQKAVRKKYGKEAGFDFVFHGGSSSPIGQIREAIGNGVVKMNLDSDTLYAFTRPVAMHLFKHFDEALRLDGEMGIKSAYDPQIYLRKAADGLSERVKEACDTLMCGGHSILREKE
ncbi:MAG: class II fructose-bisphosphate aldolase [Verrucomicrobiales bacterium]|nr:class II fructose-bisphosphate aldolase [Verrucomicrobiales bacterium]